DRGRTARGARAARGRRARGVSRRLRPGRSRCVPASTPGRDTATVNPRPRDPAAADPPARVAAPEGPSGGGRASQGLGLVLAVSALSRVLVLGVAWLASHDRPRGWLGGLTHWDGAWYTSIVAAWYPGDVATVAGDALKANLA